MDNRFADTEQNKLIQDTVISSIKNLFPIETKTRRLELANLSIKDNLSDTDFTLQKDIKLNRKSWEIPVSADLRLVDSTTGNTISSTKMRIVSLPKITRRYTAIIDGNEYQVINQLRRKPGIYTIMSRSGVLESEFNLKGLNFKMHLKPETEVFIIKFKNREYRLWTLLNAMGAADADIAKIWNQKLLDINKHGALNTEVSELQSIYKILYRKEPPTDFMKVREGIKSYFDKTEVDPEVTNITLGDSFNKVDIGSLLAASKKLLAINKGEDVPDNRDSLIFKKMFSVDDLLLEHFERNKEIISKKIQRNMDLRDNVKEIVSPTTFSKSIKDFFTVGDLSSTPPQTNPVTITTDWRKTTPMGTGGIKSRHAITLPTRDVQPTHLGYLDVLASPESSKVGVTIGLASETQKRDNDITIPVINTKTLKVEFLNPLQFYSKVVAYPSEIIFGKDGAIVKKKPIVLAMVKGETKEIPIEQVDYVINSPRTLFSLSANMIPFLSNVQGNRASTGSRMITQALPLDMPEAPLVQTMRNNKETYEQLIGSEFNKWGPGKNGKSRKGEVTSIDDNYIYIKDLTTNEIDKFGLYKDFPLNQDGYLNTTKVYVKKGDKVTNETVLIDTNYTTNRGVLSLGRNLTVGYMTYKGYNYEDGAVITESAAKKLSHTMIHRKNIFYSPKISTFNKKKFNAWFPEAIAANNLKKLDEEGLPKVGETFFPGETLACYLLEKELDDTEMALKKLNKAIYSNYSKNLLEWDEDEAGVVTDVKKVGRNIDIYIKATHPFKEGDKLSGLYGNKHVIAKIIPDSEAPHRVDGTPIEIMVNAHGVPGRMNVGQLLSTAAGKLADKLGITYYVSNFDHNIDDMSKHIKQQMEKYKLEPDEVLTMGKNGKALDNPVFVGKQYFIKLRHLSKKKMSAHNIGQYDIEELPAGKGTQKAGTMEIYGYLAHGAKANLKEISQVKGRKNEEYWRSLQFGLPAIPSSKNFVFDKMLSYLKGMGINTEKKGNLIRLMPLTDKELIDVSNGEITNPGEMLKGKNLDTRKGGLFDSEITGGIKGTKYSHISLANRMPSPVFEGAIQKILGLTEQGYENILSGKQHLNNKVGSQAIIDALDSIDVNKELEGLKETLKTAPPTNVNKLNTKIRYLRALKELNMSPTEAYTISKVLVIPPVFRPIYPLPSGDLITSDVNKHYRDVGLINSELKTAKSLLTDKDLIASEKSLYDSVKALHGFIDPQVYGEKKYKGYLKELGELKTGLIHGKAWAKRQDVSGRSVVTADPSLNLDEVGIPKEMAYTIMKPFIIQELKTSGIPVTKAVKEYESKSQLATSALQEVLRQRPVILNRAPSLHKHSIQAFKPVLVDGRSIVTNPLIVRGLNLDHDGDSVNTYVSVTYDVKKLTQILLDSDSRFKDLISIGTDDLYKKNKISLDFDTFFSYLSEVNNGKYKLKQGIKMLKQAYTTYLNGNDRTTFNVHIRDFPHTEVVTKETENVIEYEVPDYIKVYALEDGKLVLKPVTRFSIHKNLNMVKVRTSSVKEVITSEDHSLVCFDPISGNMDKFKPENAIGLLTPLPASLEMAENKETRKTFDFGWMVGALVGDGWSSSEDTKSFDKAKNRVMLANCSEPTIKKLGTLLGSKGYTISNTHDYKGYTCNSTKTTWTAKYTASYIREEIGCGAGNKHIPRDFLSWGDRALYGIISGLLDTDGSISISYSKEKPQYTASYCTISEELQYQIQQLFATVGVRTSVSTYIRNNKLVYSIYISMVDLIKIKNNLSLTVIKKQEILSEAVVSRDNKDIVPVTYSLAKYLKDIIIHNEKSLYTITCKAQKIGYISRYSAQRILTIVDQVLVDYKDWLTETKFDVELYDFISANIKYPVYSKIKDIEKETIKRLKACKNKFGIFCILRQIQRLTGMPHYMLDNLLKLDNFIQEYTNWKKIVLNDNLFWDVIKTVEPDEETTGYDLTVPGPYVFMTSNLLTVQDTMSVMVPIGKDAIEEARNMMPSKILFKHGDNKLVPTIQQEYQYGMWKLSLITEVTNKTFDSIQTAKAANISWTTQFFLGSDKKKMTIGQYYINAELPNKLKDYEREMTGKVVTQLLTTVGKEYPNDFADVINSWKSLGAQYATQQANTISLNDLVVDRSYRDILLEKELPKIKKIKDKDERVGAMMKLTDDITKAQNKYLSSIKNNMSDLLRSGSISGTKGGNVRQVLSLPGVLTDINGKPMDILFAKSYAEGLDPASYFNTMYGVRKGVVDRSVNTQESGALNKALLNVNRRLLITMEDCGTDKGLMVEVDDKNAMDRCSGETVRGVVKRNQVINSEVIMKAKQKGLRELEVRSPLTCEAVDGICVMCYGTMPNGKLADVGTNVGILESAALTERSCCNYQSILILKSTVGIELITLEQLFSRYSHLPIYVGGDENDTEIIDLSSKKLEVWDGTSWTKLHKIGRHVPTAPMVIVKTKNHGFHVCQNNHPLPVYSKNTLNWSKKIPANIDTNTDKIKTNFDIFSIIRRDCNRVVDSNLMDFYHKNGYLSNDFLYYNNDNLLHILADLIETVGIYNDNLFTINTASFHLHQQIQIICYLLNGESDYQNDASILNLKYETLYNLSKYSQKVAKHLNECRKLDISINSGISPITLIRPVKYLHPYVYDVTTESTLCQYGIVASKNTQLVMSSFHSGSAAGAGGKITAEFPRLVQLLQVPQKLAGKATLAPLKGKIISIEKNETGGWNVKISNKILIIPPGRNPIVKIGDNVNPGDPISDGVIKPQELSQLKTHLDAQKYLVAEASAIYGGDFHNKSFETVIRGTSDNAEVTEAPDNSGFLRGDKSTISNIKHLNKQRTREGLESIKYEPYFKSIDTLNTDVEDWMTKVTTNRIKAALTSGVAKAQFANVKGKDPIPAFLYGDNFGKDTDYTKGVFY